ncbi:predicted protein [Histoplasma capsulatum var. duboisii H88]|uniref:Predicted protein n=1 Tax=Ajellomyces capsulatus (strain H88) TaxID=544711 RepID=F0UTT0_AJEC8|nr:predicted protein [Histoplasma capsulatum var. duboisii H88]
MENGNELREVVNVQAPRVFASSCGPVNPISAKSIVKEKNPLDEAGRPICLPIYLVSHIEVFQDTPSLREAVKEPLPNFLVRGCRKVRVMYVVLQHEKQDANASPQGAGKEAHQRIHERDLQCEASEKKKSVSVIGRRTTKEPTKRTTHIKIFSLFEIPHLHRSPQTIPDVRPQPILRFIRLGGRAGILLFLSGRRCRWELKSYRSREKKSDKTAGDVAH